MHRCQEPAARRSLSHGMHAVMDTSSSWELPDVSQPLGMVTTQHCKLFGTRAPTRCPCHAFHALTTATRTLGVPVVPDVYMMVQRSSGLGGTAGRQVAGTAGGQAGGW